VRADTGAGNPQRLSHQAQKRACVEIALKPVAQGGVDVDGVVVAPADPGAVDVAFGDEVVDDRLHGSLGDPDLCGDVTEADVRVARDAEEYLRVVREERPGTQRPGSTRPAIAGTKTTAGCPFTGGK
jgi:hypothetical protein